MNKRITRGFILFIKNAEYNFNKLDYLYKKRVGEFVSFCFIESETDSLFNFTVVHVKKRNTSDQPDWIVTGFFSIL